MFLVGAFHFFFYALGQLFDFFGFFDYVEGEDVFVGLVDGLFEFDAQFKQFVGVALDSGGALFRGFFFHVAGEAVAGFVSIGGREGSGHRGWGGILARRVLGHHWDGQHAQEKNPYVKS
jgi:hypothetical protein